MKGVIVARGHGFARVRVARAACQRCASGKGCGAAILDLGRASDEIEVQVAAQANMPANGSEVNLVLTHSNIFTQALIGYGVPLLGLMLAVVFAGPRFADVEVAMLAGLGLVVGTAISRLLYRSYSAQSVFTLA